MANENEYSNDEITVYWKPDICIHSAQCVKGSPDVFRPKERPWVNIQASTTEAIVETIDKCPSGALSYKLAEREETAADPSGLVQIKAAKNGPLIVSGAIEIEDANGNKTVCHNKKTALCRCGASTTKPFCDGSHTKVRFFG